MYINIINQCADKHYIVINAHYPCFKTLQFIYDVLRLGKSVFLRDSLSPHVKNTLIPSLNHKNTFFTDQEYIGHSNIATHRAPNWETLKKCSGKLFLFTSGSSGSPKCVQLTAANLLSSAQIFCHWASIHEDSELLSLAPISSMSGLRSFVFIPAYTNKPTHSIEADSSNIFDIVNFIQKRKISHIVCGPPFLKQLSVLSTRLTETDFNGLSHILCTGAQFPYDCAKQLQENFGLNVLNFYGLTETYGFCIAQTKPSNNAGYLISGANAKIVDPDEHGIGRLRIISERVFEGYWPNPEKRSHFDTGDLARVKANGEIELFGRYDNAIKLPTTELVYPKQMEQLLTETLHIDNLSVATKNDQWGIRVISKLSETEIATQISKALGNQYLPHFIQLIKESDISPLGKISNL